MIKIENVVLPSPDQMFATIRGVRNAMESWDLSDSYVTTINNDETDNSAPFQFFIGEEDMKLLKFLAKTGESSEAKFRRTMPVTVDISAPLKWWKQMDTYTVGKTQQSCSTMHKIMSRHLTEDDFSLDNILSVAQGKFSKVRGGIKTCKLMMDYINALIDVYEKIGDELKLADKNDDICMELIEKRSLIMAAVTDLLPECYMQRRTVFMNYEVLAKIYHERKHHKLKEWQDFCDWIEFLPYFDEFIKD